MMKKNRLFLLTTKVTAKKASAIFRGALLLMLSLIVTSAVFANDFAEITVTGKVTSPSGAGVAGATVDVKGKTTGTSTDADGNYSIRVEETGTLVFSSIGYATQEIKVGGRTSINITLAAGAVKLEEQVVVIGYGTARKIDVTGSVGSVSGKELSKQPANNPIQSLQGKVAGLTIVNSGQPGATPTVRIRGVNSTNNSGPLYVVDGIFQTGGIGYLNPADIESIDLLKDPSSISIFGLQGGNGVIVVTTKKAARGKTRVNFESQSGIQIVQNRIDLTDATGFKQLYTTQLANIGNNDVFDYTNYNGNTNWQDEVLRKAFFSNNSVTVANSGDKTNTVFNLTYNTQEGVVRDGKLDKFITRFSQDVKIGSSLKVGGQITGYYYNSTPTNTNIIGALRAAPIIPVKSPEGFYYSTPSFQRPNVRNPLIDLERLDGTNISKGYRAVGNVFAELKIAKHFTAKSVFYGDLGFNEVRNLNPRDFRLINLGEGAIATDTTRNPNVRNSISQSSSNTRRFQQDHTLTYENTFATKHRVNALLGFTSIFDEGVNVSGSRTDSTLIIPNNPNLFYINTINQNNSGNYAGNGGGGQKAQLGIFGRVQYSFNNKYLINANIRRDGNSIYNPKNKYQTYGGVGVGWVVSKEDFFNNVKFLNYLKLRASYGTVGNGLGVAANLFNPILNTSSVGVFGTNVYPSVAPAYQPSSTLRPEIVEGTDVGLEFRTLKNRLNGELTFYQKKTKGILATYTPPGASGAVPVLDNLGDITNKGVELSLGWADKVGQFTYSISANGSYNKNKVVTIGQGFNFSLVGGYKGVNNTVSGESIGYFYGYKQIGIYQSTADLVKMAAFPDSKPGDIAYADINGDGKITPADRTYLGTPFPNYNFGGNVSVGYKNFDLNVDVNGVAGNKIFLERRTFNFSVLNYESNRLNAYTVPGSSNIEPILDSRRANNYLPSSYYLEKGDYLRIRNVQLGYTFTQKGFKQIGINSFRFFVSGQNLATFSYVSGYTPEVDINNPLSGGADNGTYPVPSTYAVGVSVVF